MANGDADLTLRVSVHVRVYTVSDEAPAHLRQETSGPLRAAAGAVPHRILASRAAIVLTCTVIGVPLGSPGVSTSGAELSSHRPLEPPPQNRKYNVQKE